MVGINTNINALFANSSLTNNQVGQTKAMQQLSTGLRVNSARDDAAGLAISTSMNSSARGMATAIRNINDGISLAQIADSSLSSVTNNLQRVRELALQSANGILLDSNRSNMQIEVKQLINEIDNISSTTNFNNIKLFSGTTNKIGLQTNTSVGDIVNLKVPLMNSRTLGLGHRSAMMAQGISSLTSQVGSLNKGLSSGDLIINGVIIGSSISKDDNLSVSDNESSAIAKVASINKMADLTGVSARVGTTVASGVPMSVGASGKSGTLTINGVSTGIITLKGDLGADRGQAVKAINLISKQTGVHAVDMGSDNLGVQLIADDGRNITIYSKSLTTSSDFNAANLGVNGVSYSAGAQITNVGIFTGTYSLQSLNDEPIKISTQTTSNIANSGLAVGVYDTNESYIVSELRPAVSAEVSSPTIILPNTYVQGGLVQGITENNTVSFGALAAGDSVQVGNLKLVASNYMSSNAVASAFQNIANGGVGSTTNGIFTGTLTSWTSSSANRNNVIFTSTAPKTDVTDLQLTTLINTYGQDTTAILSQNGSAPTPASPAIPATPGQTQVDSVTFNTMKKDDEFTLAGVTIKITSPTGISGSQLADLFANNGLLLHSSNKVNVTGNITGWAPQSNNSGTVLFQSTNANTALPTIVATGPNSNLISTHTELPGINPTPYIPPISATPGTFERDTVNFHQLGSGDKLIIAGVTLEATHDMTASEVAAVFSNNLINSNPSSIVVQNNYGIVSGNLIDWNLLSSTGNNAIFQRLTKIDSNNTPNIPINRINSPLMGANSSIITNQGVQDTYLTESATVQFGSVVAGGFVSVGGLTLKASKPMSANEVALVFQNLSANISGNSISVADGKATVTGNLDGWNSGSIGVGNTINFTSAVSNINVTDLSVSYSKSVIPKGLLAGDLKINGYDIPNSLAIDDISSNTVAVSSKKEASAISIAAAINKVENLTSVSASPRPNIIVGANFSYATQNSGTLYINGFPVEIHAKLSPPPAPPLPPDLTKYGVNSTSQIKVLGVYPSPAINPINESNNIRFDNMNLGDSFSIAGLNFTVTDPAGILGTEVAQIFQNISVGNSPLTTKAAITGSLNGWSTGNIVLGQFVTFSSDTVGTNVPDLSLDISGPQASKVHITKNQDGAPGVPAQPGIPEVSTVHFGQLYAGDQLTVAGLTFTATQFISSSDIAMLFSGLSDGAIASVNPTTMGIFTGALTGFFSNTSSGLDVDFTCSSNGPNLSVFNNIVGPPPPPAPAPQYVVSKASDIATYINSIAGATGVFASDNGSGITLTAPDGRNISLATGTDPATNTLTLENIGLGPSPTATANQQYPALKINGGPEGAITTYSTVTLNSDKSFTMSGGAKDTSLADLGLLGFKENTYGGSNDGIKIGFVDISTIEGANDALAAVENAISQISNMRSDLGAIQNKLLSAIENLTSSGINNQQSISRISDTDYGLSTTELARSQIINQAATAMLAQANQQSQLVMQLLKNN